MNKLMRNVTRLMQSGRLPDATTAIQQALKHSKTAAKNYQKFADADFSGMPWMEMMQEQAGGMAYARPAPKIVYPGQFISGTFTNAAGTRDYKLYVPTSYTGQAVPLVVMLHGCTQNPDDFAAGTRMNFIAEDNPCLVLYPAQSTKANKRNCWNWFKKKDQKRGAGEPAIIAGMTRDIMAKYNVAKARVYIAGLSAGGAMAAIMGETYPDLYAAIGVHSGLAYGVAQDLPGAFKAMQGGGKLSTRVSAARLVPTIIFHGDADTDVHVRNGDQIIAQLTGSRPHLEQLTASVEKGRNVQGAHFTRTLYCDSAGQCLIEDWRVHGAAHAWSGGSRDGSYTDPAGPDAATIMLQFFAKHKSAAA